MSIQQVDLKLFFNRYCFDTLFRTVARCVSEHPSILNSRYTSVGCPDLAWLDSVMIETVQNVFIEEDAITCDIIISCEATAETENIRQQSITKEVKTWLRCECTAQVTDRVEAFTVRRIEPYERVIKDSPNGIAASTRLVPLITKEQYEEEAEAFLLKYCPEALEYPMQIPIRQIAEQLGLDLLMQHSLSEDLSYYGEICFAEGTIPVWDPFQQDKTELEVKRGTILIDPMTFFEYNMGCVNNTIAHEVFHWHRHRLYASIRRLLSEEPMIAHRCPRSNCSVQSGDKLSDEQWMEIQANAIAPRILMPYDMFIKKTDELFEQYRYYDSPIKLAILECVVNDLAKFFSVSRQSAIIRMIETGHKEANALKLYDDNSDICTYMDISQAFLAYCTNKELRRILDEGRFAWVDGYYVINDPKYISRSESGNVHLTELAWNNLGKCTLQFTKKTADNQDLQGYSALFHRANAGGHQKVPCYEAGLNARVVAASAELQSYKDAFARQQQQLGLRTFGMTCWQYIYAIIESEGLKQRDFCDKTLLGEEVYKRARQNYNSIPDKRTIMAIAYGLDLDPVIANTMMELAGHTFTESPEDQALRFCSSLRGKDIYERNEILTALGYKPVGSRNYN